MPQDVTIRRCYIRRKLSYLKAHATYQPACDQAGAGTIASESGNDVTFSEAHGLSLGTYGPFIKDLTLGEYREVTVIVNPTTVTLASAFSSDPAGHSWRYNAVDIANACGTAMYAAAEGLVTAVTGVEWNEGYGSYIIIEHPNGTKTRYSHNEKNTVSVGDYVAQGDLIGYIGNSGNTHGPTGCHLHFEVMGARNPFAK